MSNYKNRNVQFPNRRKLIKVADDVYDIVSDGYEGEIYEEGTPLLAETLNEIVDGVDVAIEAANNKKEFYITTQEQFDDFMLHTWDQSISWDRYEKVFVSGKFYVNSVSFFPSNLALVGTNDAEIIIRNFNGSPIFGFDDRSPLASKPKASIENIAFTVDYTESPPYGHLTLFDEIYSIKNCSINIASIGNEAYSIFNDCKNIDNISITASFITSKEDKSYCFENCSNISNIRYVGIGNNAGVFKDCNFISNVSVMLLEVPLLEEAWGVESNGIYFRAFEIARV